jgi:hypothetical protein
MESEEEIREEEKKEKQTEQKVIIYLFLGLFVVIGIIYLYSRGILGDLITWERGEQEEPRKKAEQQETTSKIRSRERAVRRSHTSPEEKKDQSGESTEIDTILSSLGVPTLTLIAPHGTSRDDLKKLCQSMRAQHTGKTRLTIAIYADTPIGRQIARGMLKHPSPAMIRLNQLLLYTFDPDKGEQYTFPPF